MSPQRVKTGMGHALMQQIRHIWSSGAGGRIALVGAGLMALVCIYGTGLFAMAALLPSTPTAAATEGPTLQEVGTEALTSTPGRSPSRTATALPTDTPTPTSTEIPATLVPMTDLPTLTATYPEPPTLTNTSTPTTTSVPTELPTATTNPWAGCPNLNCPDFATCSQVRDFLTVCPQWWRDLDRDGDGVPCEDLCG